MRRGRRSISADTSRPTTPRCVHEKVAGESGEVPKAFCASPRRFRETRGQSLTPPIASLASRTAERRAVARQGLRWAGETPYPQTRTVARGRQRPSRKTAFGSPPRASRGLTTWPRASPRWEAFASTATRRWLHLQQLHPPTTEQQSRLWMTISFGTTLGGTLASLPLRTRGERTPRWIPSLFAHPCPSPARRI